MTLREHLKACWRLKPDHWVVVGVGTLIQAAVVAGQAYCIGQLAQAVASASPPSAHLLRLLLAAVGLLGLATGLDYGLTLLQHRVRLWLIFHWQCRLHLAWAQQPEAMRAHRSMANELVKLGQDIPDAADRLVAILRTLIQQGGLGVVLLGCALWWLREFSLCLLVGLTWYWTWSRLLRAGMRVRLRRLLHARSSVQEEGLVALHGRSMIRVPDPLVESFAAGWAYVVREKLVSSLRATTETSVWLLLLAVALWHPATAGSVAALGSGLYVVRHLLPIVRQLDALLVVRQQFELSWQRVEETFT